MTALPNPDLSEVLLNFLKYWQIVTNKTEEFWKRWSNEYLNQLQQRYKLKKAKNEIKTGDAVLVKEDNSSPLYWPFAQIIEVHFGKDNIVRIVTLRMRLNPFGKVGNLSDIEFGNLKHPVQKLVYLPDPTYDTI